MIVGLTGLIGSGKSTVSNYFAELGVHIIDTDIIAHQITAINGVALPLIYKEFGGNVFTDKGALNRSVLREVIFADENKRVILENILHPLIFVEVEKELAVDDGKSYKILVVPLLFRSQKYLTLINRSIFVDSDYELLLSRLNKRSNLDKIAVDAILSQQVPREQQLKLADDIILNNGDIDKLQKQILKLHQKYLSLS